MTPEIPETEVKTSNSVEDDNIEETFLLASGGSPVEAELRRIDREDAAADADPAATDAGPRSRSRELREGAEAKRSEAITVQRWMTDPERIDPIPDDDPLEVIAKRFGMGITELGELVKEMLRSEEPHIVERGLAIRKLVADAEALVEPFVNPIDAFVGGAVGAGKMAGRLGLRGVGRLAPAARGATAALTTEVPVGLAIESVAEDHPYLAFPFALALGLFVGGTIESALERGMFRGQKALVDLWLVRRAAKIKAGVNPDMASDHALKSVIADADPSDVAALAEKLQEIAPRKGPIEIGEKVTTPQGEGTVVRQQGKLLMVEMDAGGKPRTFEDVEVGRKPTEPAVVEAGGAQPFVLPKELAKASPRYSYQHKQFTLVFEDDLDRALYIVADGAKRSKSDDAFMALLKAHTGLGEDEIRRLGREVRNEIKGRAKTAETGELVIPKTAKADAPVGGGKPLEVVESEGEGGVRKFEFFRDGEKVAQSRLLGDTIGMIEVEESFRREGIGLLVLEEMRQRGGVRGIAGSEEGAALMARSGMVDESGGFQEFPGGPRGEGVDFVSPNLADNLDIDSSAALLRGDEQARFRSLSEDVNSQLGLTGKVNNAVGEWRDAKGVGGAEPTLETRYQGVDFETIKYAASLKARLGHQKFAIAFIAQEDGPDALVDFLIPKSKGTMKSIAQDLTDDGIEFKTLIPEGDDIRVSILDTGKVLGAELDKVKSRYKIDGDFTEGKGEFIGGETRAEGLKAFNEIDAEYVLRFPGRKHYSPAGEGGLRNLDLRQQQPGAQGAQGAQGKINLAAGGAPGSPPPEPIVIRKGSPEEIKRFVETDPSTVTVGEHHVLKVDWSAIGDHDEIEGAINKISAFHAKHIDEARRNILTDKAVKELADELGMTPEALLSKRAGEAFNAEETRATKELLGASSNNLRAISRRVEAGDPSAVADMAKALGIHVKIQEVFFGARAEWGRTGRILQQNPDGTLAYAKRLAKLIEEAKEEGGSVVLNRVRGTKPGIDPVNLAQAILDMDSPAALAGFARKLARPGGVDMFFELWYAGILGPQTIVVNLVSNTLFAFESILERGIAARFSRGGVEVGEATVMAYGLVSSFMDGIRVAVKGWKTGVSEFGPEKFQGGLPPAIRGENLDLTGVAGRAVDAFGYFVRTDRKSVV